MSSRRKQIITEDVSLETTVPTDLSFSPDEVSELYNTDDDRLRTERVVGRSGQVTVVSVSPGFGFYMKLSNFMPHQCSDVNKTFVKTKTLGLKTKTKTSIFCFRTKTKTF